MYALPPDAGDDGRTVITGISCPDCAGVLEVAREGRGTFQFVCRVKHTFSVEDLLTGKEEKIESDLWAAIRVFEELIALLEDLDRHAARRGEPEIVGSHAGRIGRAREHAQRLRDVVEENRPVDLTLVPPVRGR